MHRESWTTSRRLRINFEFLMKQNKGARKRVKKKTVAEITTTQVSSKFDEKHSRVFKEKGGVKEGGHSYVRKTS